MVLVIGMVLVIMTHRVRHIRDSIPGKVHICATVFSGVFAGKGRYTSYSQPPKHHPKVNALPTYSQPKRR